jgi:hypothetical protein
MRAIGDRMALASKGFKGQARPASTYRGARRNAARALLKAESVAKATQREAAKAGAAAFATSVYDAPLA